MYAGITIGDDIHIYLYSRVCHSHLPGSCLNECEKMAVHMHVLDMDCDIIAILT